MTESPRHLKVIVVICVIWTAYSILSYIYYSENVANNTVCSVPPNQTCLYEEPYLTRGCSDLLLPRLLLISVTLLILFFVICVQAVIYRYIRHANSDVGKYYITSLGMSCLIGAVPAIMNIVIYVDNSLGSYSCTEEWAGCSPVCFTDYPAIAVMWICMASVGLCLINAILFVECFIEVWWQTNRSRNVIELEQA